MIYITGDTHGEIDIHKLSRHNFDYTGLTKSDYIIICGDFGFVWYGNRKDEWWLKWLENLPCTILFCDGNHENFDALSKYPVEKWHGGNVHKIKEHVLHLMRGEVYEIDNKTFWIMGGAESHDKEFRTDGINWWSQELPSEEEMCNGLSNLHLHDYSVDYVITHCYPLPEYPTDNSLISFFDLVEHKMGLKCKHWYFGHYHIDKDIDDKHTCLYNKIIKLEANQEKSDKMFQRLGYERIIKEDTKATGTILYEDKVQECKIYYSKGYFSKNIKVCGVYEPINFSSDEILACAQLINELNK